MVNKEIETEAMTKIQFKTILRNEIRDEYKESTLPLLPYQEGEGELLEIENVFIMTQVGIPCHNTDENLLKAFVVN